MTTLFDKIKEVTELSATSGFEAPVRDYLRKNITPLVDEVQTDGLGGIFGIKHSQAENAPKVLVAAHMDEVGFMIKEIKQTGLSVSSNLVVGTHWLSAHNASPYTLVTVVSILSSQVQCHLISYVLAVGIQVFLVFLISLDAGFANQEEANAYGVFPGDVIIPESETILTANQKNVISKAWDNRYGVLMIRELLENVKDQELNNTLIAGANVQEEVGLRGAHVSTTKFDPEVFFAVDCSPAGDIYGDQGKVGDGTLIRFFDPGHIMLPNMKDFLLTTAEEAGIKYQYYCAAGGTDAGAAHLQNAGVPSTTIGVCARYIHSHQTLYAMDDFLEAQAFLQAIVKKLDRSTVDLIKNY